MTARRLLPLFLLLALAGCGREPDAPTAAGAAAAPSTTAEESNDADDASIGTLEAVALELGTALDADGRVSATTERVRAGDTVHVSLVTVGDAEGAPIAVRWRDAAGTVLAEDERTVTAAGPAVHTFSRKPEAPWAPGRYEVEVLLGGESAGVRAFEVR